MAAKSLNAYATKLTLVFLVCIGILAPLATAHTAAPRAGEKPDPFLTEEFSFFQCISFISEATKCVIDVFKHAVAPHPSCCKAISELNDCSSSFLKGTPTDEMNLIKNVCALWGFTIP